MACDFWAVRVSDYRVTEFGLSKFEPLALNDVPPTFESTYGILACGLHKFQRNPKDINLSPTKLLRTGPAEPATGPYLQCSVAESRRGQALSPTKSPQVSIIIVFHFPFQLLYVSLFPLQKFNLKSSNLCRRTGPAQAAIGAAIRAAIGVSIRYLSPTKLLVEKHAGEVSSSELGPTSTDLSKFEALALNDVPPTFESTYGILACGLHKFQRNPKDRNLSPTKLLRTGPAEAATGPYLQSKRSGGRRGQAQSPTKSLRTGPAEAATGAYLHPKRSGGKRGQALSPTKLPRITAIGVSNSRTAINSNSLRRSRGKQGRTLSPIKLPDKQHAGEVSSSEHGPTSMDLSKFEALALNDMPPTFESTDGVVMYAGDMGSGVPDSTIAELSAVEEPLTPRRTGPAGAATGTHVRQIVLYSDRPRRSRGIQGVEEHAGEVSSSELGPRSTDLSKFEALALNDMPPTFESTDGVSAAEEPLSPRSKRIREIESYMAKHRFDDLREALAAVANGFRDQTKNAAVPDTEPSKAKSSPGELDAQSFQTPRQTSEAPKVSECLASPTEDPAQSKVSTEEIVQNGKIWMSKEVMSAFEKYIEGRDEFKGMEYDLDELQNQCFSVETYHKIFHHYNFTVKMKKPTSDDWSSTQYFAEVKEIYGEKFYFCCALEPYDNGYCHACKNQKMDALKHPADHVGFEIGQADMECPFFYTSD